MEVKSYYLKRHEIVCKDFHGNTTILELNRNNILKLISSLDKQINGNLTDIIDREDALYRKYIDVVAIMTILEAISCSMVIFGFINASYYMLILGLLLSLGFVFYTFFISYQSIKELRKVNMEHKMYEGREILINKYNSLAGVSDAKLVDVY